METHHHNFDRIEQYLHHRDPYLLVERINSIAPNKIVTQSTVSKNQPFIKGHFPGAPIFPGAMMQELTTQSAGILIAARHNPMREYNTDDPFHNEYALGVLANVQRARYKGFAKPGDTMVVSVTLNEQVDSFFDFSASITVGKRTIMQNAFRLINIQSSLLYEEQASPS